MCKGNWDVTDIPYVHASVLALLWQLTDQVLVKSKMVLAPLAF